MSAETDSALRIIVALLSKAKGTGDTEHVSKIIAELCGRRWRRRLEDLATSITNEMLALQAQQAIPAETAGSQRERLILSFLAALMLELRSVVVGTFGASEREVIRSAASSLLAQGAASVSDVALESGSALSELTAAAERDLGLLLAGRLEARSTEVEALLRGALTADPFDVKAFREELRKLLGVAVDGWIPPAVDAWAFRWRNAGSILAAVQQGRTNLRVLNNPPKGPDSHTTPFCRYMHGGLLSVAQMQRQVLRYTDSVLRGDAGARAALWPLRDATRVGEGNAGAFPIEAAGIGPPPWHWLCRTILVAA